LAAWWTRLLPLPTTAERRTASKKCFKDVAKSARASAAEWITSITTTANTCFAELVISRTLIRVRQHFICVRHFFKFGFGFRISRVCIWVQLASAFAIRTLYFIGISTARNT
jgi:hypothetical protein